MSDGAHLRGLVPGLHNSKGSRSVGDTVPDVTSPGSKPRTQTFSTESDVINNVANQP